MVESEEIYIPSLISRLPETFYMFQRKRYLCDVMIITANGFIPAHRVVLVAGSQYFYDADTMRTYTNSKDPNFHLNYDIEDVRKVVNMLYTGKLMINKVNADRIAAICAELRLNEALEKCLMFMAELGITNSESLANLPERRTESMHKINNDKQRAYDIFNTEDERGDSSKKSVSKRKNTASVDEVEDKGKSRKKTKRTVTKKGKKSQMSDEFNVSDNGTKSQTGEECSVSDNGTKSLKEEGCTVSDNGMKSLKEEGCTVSDNGMKSLKEEGCTESDNGMKSLKEEGCTVSDNTEHSTESVITIQPIINPDMSVEETVNQGNFTESRIDPSVEQAQTSTSFVPEISGEFTKETTPTEKDVGTNELQPCMFMDLNELKVFQSNPHHAEKVTIIKQFDPDGAITDAYEQDQEFLGTSHVEKRVNCRTCKMVFKDAQSLTEHRREIHPSNFKKQRFVCDICNAKPNNHVTLIEHKFRKHGITYDKSKYPLYRCDEQDCEFETIVPYKLSEHRNTVHSGLSCMCETCGRAFKSKSVLKYHIQSTHSESRPTFICNTCGKTYFTGQALKKHMEYHTGTQKRLLCHLCPYSSVGRQELNNHLLKLHNVPVPKKTKVHQCEKCDYYSLNRTQFNRHVAMHDGRDKAYTCSECDKSFPSSYNLKSHERRHRAETVKCPHDGCNFFTKFKHILKNHITGKHTNTNFKPYKCHLCEHSCKLKGNLNKHLVNKHGLEVMTEVKQRKIALETGQGYNEILVDRAKSRIANTIPVMFPQEEESLS